MRKSILTTAILAGLYLTGCTPASQEAINTEVASTEAAKPAVQASEGQINASNVLLKKSVLQYQAPEFDKIKIGRAHV